MKTKLCPTCKETKEHSGFYKNKTRKDGLRHECKSCASDTQRKWIIENKEKQLGRDRKYRRVNAGRLVEHRREYRACNGERYKAHTMVNNAVRDGRLDRQLCFMCGNKADAHHSCYALPLVVTWLCPEHHKEIHRANP